MSPDRLIHMANQCRARASKNAAACKVVSPARLCSRHQSPSRMPRGVEA
jgi:hypothetical protein